MASDLCRVTPRDHSSHVSIPLERRISSGHELRQESSTPRRRADRGALPPSSCWVCTSLGCHVSSRLPPVVLIAYRSVIFRYPPPSPVFRTKRASFAYSDMYAPTGQFRFSFCFRGTCISFVIQSPSGRSARATAFRWLISFP